MLSPLLDAIDAAVERRAREPHAVPWLGWLVVALLRQCERQAWHRTIVDTRLRRESGEEGTVPGLPGWTYDFHGIGCCLTGPDGEALDVDRRDDAAAIIDPYFFAWRVRTIRALRFPEVRLWRWMPSDTMIVSSLSCLRDLGALVYPNGAHLFHLAPALEDRVRAVTACDFNEPATQARWLSAFGDSDSPATLEAHREWVGERARDPEHAFHVLAPAREILRADDLVELCLHHLEGPAGPSMGRALETLDTCAADATEAVLAVLSRLSTTVDPPYPAYQALAYLLGRAPADARIVDYFQTFSAVEKAAGFGGNPFLSQYAVLALRFLPSLAMGLVRRALRSSTPMCVSEVATLLAAIDQPWCVRELGSALDEDPKASSIAEALRRCGGDLGRKRAARGYVPPTHDASAPGYSWEEVQHNSAAGMMEEGLREVEPLANELRERYPATWEG